VVEDVRGVVVPCGYRVVAVRLVLPVMSQRHDSGHL
jgi:hypothetical protein